MGGGCNLFSDEIKDVDLGESILNEKIYINAELQKYQSGEALSRKILDSNPSGNGDITSILKILPNVQFDNAQLRSTTPGEIDPANISIFGGLFYQNNFQLDGFNMNNDLDPLGVSNPNAENALPGRSQGLNIDTSLLESIKVQDSNVSAAYGGFTGGVVEANTRRPTKKFGANISYQIAQGDANPNAFSLTQYYLFGDDRDEFLNSTQYSNQPKFIKHLFRSSFEYKLSDNAGVIASFTTTQSFIPLNGYSASYINSTLDDKRKTQKRQSYNFFIKGYYDIGDKVRLESSYTYAPQYNNYFIVNTRNSDFDLQSGGHQATFKAIWDNTLGLLTAQTNFNYIEQSRSNSLNTRKIWRYSSDKNWNPGGDPAEGGYGNVDTTQITWNTKLIQDFKPLEFGIWSNKFHTGLDAGYVNASYLRKADMMTTQLAPTNFLPNGATCTDTQWCSNANVPNKPRTRTNWTPDNAGQWISRVTFIKTGKINLDSLVLGAFIEDDMRFDFKNFGELNARAGLRLDYDTYMEKTTFAPRFSLNYIAPWSAWGDLGNNLSTQFSFGANRYYGRNLFAYRLEDGRNSLIYSLTRTQETTPWENALSTQNKNNTNFKKLKVPYSDELMAGIMQKIFLFNLGAKYIHRFGRDEIRRMCVDVNGKIATRCATTSSNVSIYTNEGRSQSNVVSISLQNDVPLEFFNTEHFMLFAIDWTNVLRNYADYSDILTNPEIANEWISYNGQLMRYADRPAENFMRPYTIRLTTTHNFNIWRTKWFLNNFFRFRSGYEAIVATSNSQRDQFIIDGVLTPVTTFKVYQVPASFTWDMRVGFEMDVYSGNTFYVNVDIYNVLNKQNVAIASASYSPSAGTTAVPVYEVGRQFWVQVGYKF